jgi:hypothetical protein
MRFRLRDDEFIDRIDIRLRAGDDDVGIRAVTAIDARIMRLRFARPLRCDRSRLECGQSLAERVNAFGDGVNVELKQFAWHIDNRVDGFVGRIHWTRADQRLACE